MTGRVHKAISWSVPMADLTFLILTTVLFVLVFLVAKAVERL